MAPPKGIEFCWYWLEKLYSPMRSRIAANGRKRDHFPGLLLQHMADEIFLMQSLHDDHHAAVGLVIETAEQGVVVPVVDGLSAGFRQGFIWFQGVVDDDEVTAAAGQYSANRGCHSSSVVAKSWTASRSASRVGNRLLYQALCMTVRQSRASLSAKS